MATVVPMPMMPPAGGMMGGMPQPPPVAEGAEEPTALLKRVRRLAGILLVLRIATLPFAGIGIVPILSIVVLWLGYRSTKTANRRHLRLFNCMTACGAVLSVAALLAVAIIGGAAIDCACDKECVASTYDFLQRSREWALNARTPGTAEYDTWRQHTEGVFPPAEAPGNAPASAPAAPAAPAAPTVNSSTGRSRKLFAVANWLLGTDDKVAAPEPAVGDVAAPEPAMVDPAVDRNPALRPVTLPAFLPPAPAVAAGEAPAHDHATCTGGWHAPFHWLGSHARKYGRMHATPTMDAPPVVAVPTEGAPVEEDPMMWVTEAEEVEAPMTRGAHPFNAVRRHGDRLHAALRWVLGHGMRGEEAGRRSSRRHHMRPPPSDSSSSDFASDPMPPVVEEGGSEEGTVMKDTDGVPPKPLMRMLAFRRRLLGVEETAAGDAAARKHHAEAEEEDEEAIFRRKYGDDDEEDSSEGPMPEDLGSAMLLRFAQVAGNVTEAQFERVAGKICHRGPLVLTAILLLLAASTTLHVAASAAARKLAAHPWFVAADEARRARRAARRAAITMPPAAAAAAGDAGTLYRFVPGTGFVPVTGPAAPAQMAPSPAAMPPAATPVGAYATAMPMAGALQPMPHAPLGMPASNPDVLDAMSDRIAAMWRTSRAAVSHAMASRRGYASLPVASAVDDPSSLEMRSVPSATPLPPQAPMPAVHNPYGAAPSFGFAPSAPAGPPPGSAASYTYADLGRNL